MKKIKRIANGIVLLVIIAGLLTGCASVGGNSDVIAESSSAVNTIDINTTDDNIMNVEQFAVTVNINPKNLYKWQSNSYPANVYVQDIDTTVRDGITVNTQVPTADGIEIYFLNGIVIKTHDTVKIEDEKIIIAEDTFIYGNGNIGEEGKGKFTIIDKDGVKIDINGGNQSPYTGENANGEALESYNESGIKSITDFLPYMSKDAIDEIARAEYEKVDGLDKFDEMILAIMSKDVLNELLKKEYEKNGFKNIPDVALMSLYGENTEALDELVIKEYEKNGFESIPDYALIYMSKDILAGLVIKQAEKDGLNSVSDYAIMSLAEEKDILSKLAKDEYEKNGFDNFSNLFYSYISENVIDELVMKEYNKIGVDGDYPIQLYSYMSDSLKKELGIEKFYVDGSDWYKYYGGDKAVAIFSDGNKMTMLSPGSTNHNSSSIQFSGECIIEYINGITVNVTDGTKAVYKNGIYTITLGNGDATITLSDGTETTIPAGTILDNEGNVIES